ncbi:Arc family DNA-binding protein [Shinella sp.]|uniref:Arc family DNA-binding protein n=1 Tax=Shinella sp. TaxID=1870904 RepID=UPI003F6F5A5C
MADKEVRITLRLPEGLRDKLEASASETSRSMNGEIVDRLDATFERATEREAHVKRLRESERRMMKTIGDLSASRAETEKALATMSDRIAELVRENARLEKEVQGGAQRTAGWEDWATRKFTDENTLYVLLDADGHPQSWDEIMTHLQAISTAVGGNIERIEAGVVDAKRVSSDLRTEQWLKLREFYRAQRKPKK